MSENAPPVSLDAKDLAILQAVDFDCRRGLSEIARLVRISKSAVSQRIARLEKEGLIEGYYAVIDSSRLGYLSFRVYLKFYKASPKKEAELASFLFREKKIWWIGKIQGKWDLGFVIWAKNLSDFRDFWSKFLLSFRQNIANHCVCPYASLRNFSISFSQKAAPSREAGVVGEGKSVELDEVDRRLLKIVSTNARDSIVALAKKSGLTPAIVNYRLKQLVKIGVIQRFRAKVNVAKIGYSLYKLEFYLDDVSRLGEMNAFAGSLPSLAYVDETIGGADFEPDFYLKSEQELEGVLDKFKARFFSTIRQIDYIVYSKELKYAYFPD